MRSDRDNPYRVAFRVKRAEFWSGDLGLTLLTISVAVLIFVVTPLREAGLPGRIGCYLIVMGLMISGALAVKRSGVFTWVLIVAVLVSAVILVAGRFHPTPALHVAGSALVTATLVLYIRVVLVVMFRGGPVTWVRIQGGICAYLLLGLAWASLFELLEQVHPGSFRFVSAPADLDQLTSKLTYYSFATLTTVGSEISAVHPFARSLTIAEAIVGQLFPAIFIGALVAIAVQSRLRS